MVFPSSCSSFQFWASGLFDNVNQNERQVSCVRSFVENLIINERKGSLSDESASPLTVPHPTSNPVLSYIKGNYVEKKGSHLGVHWQMLKNW